MPYTGLCPKETEIEIRKRFCDIKTRCYNQNRKGYKDYGGRGIKICDLWLYDVRNFVRWALENGYEKSLQIDRIDNDGDYSPENCRWITPKENMLNTRNRSNTGYRFICYRPMLSADGSYYIDKFYVIYIYKELSYYSVAFATLEEAIEARNKFLEEHSIKCDRNMRKGFTFSKASVVNKMWKKWGFCGNYIEVNGVVVAQKSR